MGDRYIDWFRQAEADPRYARNALEDTDYEWSCFGFNHEAEKALKAVFKKFGMDAWGQPLTSLIGNLPPEVDQTEGAYGQYARMLGKFYISERYPNGFDSGVLTDYYTAEETWTAIRMAEAIIEYCHVQIN